MLEVAASAGEVPVEKKNSIAVRILHSLTNKDSRRGLLLGLIGTVGFLFFWWLATEKLKLPRFEKLPGPVLCWNEFISRDPVFGTSIFTPQYYMHIMWSCLRILAGFTIATCLGVPLGLFMGWKKKVRDYAFPVLELLRPIPTMAWVPLAILMFSGREAPIIFLACLASFFATVLNTLLGVDSIDEVYFRAAMCLGASERNVFTRVVIPGALPFIFTGLQISMGVAWFSLVAAEMLSGEYGLGYLIWDSYVLSQYPVIVIGMATLGLIGYFCSAIIRMVGNQLMRWTVR
ncbi:ABC transporter permease [Desulfovibrio sp. 86]|uniref:Binding--dependent transport system inner membrane component family protein n=1 Tax=uncultured Desulfovibrio sp. TaxID=167968 RepID=A0A212KYP3_9BACT|nr:ABC transporter permease [Desulfovibrio sp. 86]SCM70376.1 Binding--dependent transport system inner membrane component family protein [uncultured Desulfovibrio sp.]VZH32242.1 Binding--dependent transport system inner membrane component family protein [Desulfovibrio sp. 86]